ncbi:MAG: helix-turn-helix transcriptional regulator [Eubacteriales bacterium]|nr:helix-turn-helix transcriptional regulator [Eubacteriales bacterium]
MTVQERLHMTITKSGDTLTAFARRVGYSRSYIYNVLNGERPPTNEFMETIGERYAINVEWLATGKGEMNDGETEMRDSLHSKIDTLTVGDLCVVNRIVSLIAKEER